MKMAMMMMNIFKPPATQMKNMKMYFLICHKCTCIWKCGIKLISAELNIDDYFAEMRYLNFESNDIASRSRMKFRNQNQWKCVGRKQLRNEGKSYTTRIRNIVKENKVLKVGEVLLCSCLFTTTDRAARHKWSTSPSSSTRRHRVICHRWLVLRWTPNRRCVGRVQRRRNASEGGRHRGYRFQTLTGQLFPSMKPVSVPDNGQVGTCIRRPQLFQFSHSQW